MNNRKPIDMDETGSCKHYPTIFRWCPHSITVTLCVLMYVITGLIPVVSPQMTLLGGECGPGTPCGGVGYVVGNLVKELQTQTAEYRELRRELRSLRREIGRLKREMVAGKVALAELTVNMTKQASLCSNSNTFCGDTSSCCSGDGPHPECCSVGSRKTKPTSSTMQTAKSRPGMATATTVRKENPQMIGNRINGMCFVVM